MSDDAITAALKQRRALARSAASLVAAQSMTAILSSLELSILAVVCYFDTIEKAYFFANIPRDQSTISHAVTNLLQKKLVGEFYIDRNFRFLHTTESGKAVYAEYKQKERAVLDNLQKRYAELIG